MSDETEFGRHIVANGGWIFDTVGAFYESELAARRHMLANGWLERSRRDGRITLELTDAGRAWLAKQEAQ